MKKPFYEVLWHIAKKEGLISKLLSEGYLINTKDTYAWTSKTLESIGLESVVGVLISEDESEDYPDIPFNGLPNKTSKSSKKVDLEKDIEWIEEFMQKFANKNVGVSGKSSNKKAVVKKMNQYLIDYDFSKEEIITATEAYIDNLKNTNSIRFIQESHYFISKVVEGVQTSNLAKWCEEVRNNGGSAKKYTSHTIL